MPWSPGLAGIVSIPLETGDRVDGEAGIEGGDWRQCCYHAEC